MELIFIRHGQGEHNRNHPDGLNIMHPHLTELGKEQVLNLRARLNVNKRDVFVVSPTVRTIETADLLSNGIGAAKYISPLAGPRMFPLLAGANTLPCDITLSLERIRLSYPDFHILDYDDSIWREGINQMEETRFARRGIDFLARCTKLIGDRILFVAHDGTINQYRKILGEHQVTRQDFLGEAGCCRITIPSGIGELSSLDSLLPGP